jgi:aryl-alcohol dehydrogenase-like predicted oxidoreductase
MGRQTVKTARLGVTGLESTCVGSGAWAIGGGNWVFGPGSEDDEQPVAMIHCAVDLCQVDWPTPVGDIEEGWAALAELQEQGLVRHTGVSNFDIELSGRV